MQGDKTWICIEFEEEDIAELEREGQVLGYCRVVIEHQRLYDSFHDRWHDLLIVKTSIGQYRGYYDDYSDLCERFTDKGWLLYKERRAYGLGGPPLEQIWVRLIPTSPIGQEEIEKLENEGVETEYYTVVIKPDVGVLLMSDFINGRFDEDKRFEIWGSDGTYKVCNNDELNKIVETLKRDGWRLHKSQTMLLAQALMMWPTMVLRPSVSEFKFRLPDDQVQVMTWVRFEPPAIWRLRG